MKMAFLHYLLVLCFSNPILLVNTNGLKRFPNLEDLTDRFGLN